MPYLADPVRTSTLFHWLRIAYQLFTQSNSPKSESKPQRNVNIIDGKSNNNSKSEAETQNDHLTYDICSKSHH